MTDREALLEARYRAEVLDAVDASIERGLSTSAAVALAAAHYGIGDRTVWRWRDLAAGRSKWTRLLALRPLRRPTVLNLCEACAVPGGIPYQSGRTALTALANMWRHSVNGGAA